MSLDTEPAEGFSLFDPRRRVDPYPGYAALHSVGGADARLRRTAFGPWLSPAHAVCAQVLRDPGFGRAEPPDDGRTRSFLALNPPDHTRLRRLAAKAFTPRLVEELRPRIERLAEELLDHALREPEFDLVREFAHPLPVIVMRPSCPRVGTC